MKTEEQIERAIELYKDNLHDHHIWLNEPLVTQALIAHYQTVILVLEWVLDRNQSSTPMTRKAE